jgi:hypothetical protein
MNRGWWSLRDGGIAALVALAMGLLMAVSTPVAAQDGKAGGRAAAGVPAAGGPTQAAASVGVRAPDRAGAATDEALESFQGSRSSNKQATTLMIVGTAALLVGAIIGGDAGTIIMVGGAVIGLFGLYRFLQ